MSSAPLPSLRTRAALFFCIASLGLAADLVTKWLVFDWLGMPGGRTWWLVERYVGIQTSLNEGALFGIGQGQVLWLALFSVAASLGILYYLFIRAAARDLYVTIVLACILAGILGNLFDRVGLHRLTWADGGQVFAVRDWILFQASDRWRWPNFNLADSLLVCGAVSLSWRVLREPKPSGQPTPETAPS